MKMESYYSLGVTIILLALFAQNYIYYIFGQRYILSRSCDIVSHSIFSSKHSRSKFFSSLQGIKNKKVTIFFGDIPFFYNFVGLEKTVTEMLTKKYPSWLWKIWDSVYLFIFGILFSWAIRSQIFQGFKLGEY